MHKLERFLVWMFLTSKTFNIHQGASGTQLAEEEPLFTHRPNAILREVEVGHDSASIDFANKRSGRIPYVNL
jgi:hypothetical protein